MIRNADHILCISNCTRRDLANWAKLNNEVLPATSILPLGCQIQSPKEPEVSPRIQEIISQKYLLCVGTIETRKNHEVLYRAYARCHDKQIRNLPLLVFVGEIGQGSDYLISNIKSDPRVSGKIVVLSGVSDFELAELYKNCLFTLYPSLYEGWGLPVSESLAYGKFCITSNCGSLPEAGGDFAGYADPWNAEEWANLIYLYASNNEALQEKEAHIKSSFSAKKWMDSASHILEQKIYFQ
jgi:glycosyltransferase involved in cell wall biosynthesis